MTTQAPASAATLPGRAALARDVPTFMALFLERFAARDVDGIIELWDVPALVLGDEQVHGAMSVSHLAKLFAEAMLPRAGAAFGTANAEPGLLSDPIESVEWPSVRVAIVKLRWPGRTLEGFLHGVDSTIFALRVDQFHNLKIRALLLGGARDFKR
jgi:hypothetical protein